MAVAAAALVLAVVFAVVVGFLPTAAGPGITYADPMPFSQFIAQAESVAHSAEDGPWTPVAVLGLGESVSAAGTAAGAVLGAANCTDVWAASGTYTLPATPSNAPTGEVSAWFVFSTDTTYRALLTMVTNVSGTVQAANLEIVPQSCISGFSSYQPLPAATSVVDSTTVATAANGQGGSAFLSSHPQATSEFLVSNFSGNVTWTVLYTTCTFISGGTETGETFVASLNATTGAVFTAGAETMSCS